MVGGCREWGEASERDSGDTLERAAIGDQLIVLFTTILQFVYSIPFLIKSIPTGCVLKFNITLVSLRHGGAKQHL